MESISDASIGAIESEPTKLGSEIRDMGIFESNNSDTDFLTKSSILENKLSEMRSLIACLDSHEYKSTTIGDYSTISLNWSLLYCHSASNLPESL